MVPSWNQKIAVSFFFSFPRDGYSRCVISLVRKHRVALKYTMETINRHISAESDQTLTANSKQILLHSKHPPMITLSPDSVLSIRSKLVETQRGSKNPEQTWAKTLFPVGLSDCLVTFFSELSETSFLIYTPTYKIIKPESLCRALSLLRCSFKVDHLRMEIYKLTINTGYR